MFAALNAQWRARRQRKKSDARPAPSRARPQAFQLNQQSLQMLRVLAQRLWALRSEPRLAKLAEPPWTRSNFLLNLLVAALWDKVHLLGKQQCNKRTWTPTRSLNFLTSATRLQNFSQSLAWMRLENITANGAMTIRSNYVGFAYSILF